MSSLATADPHNMQALTLARGRTIMVPRQLYLLCTRMNELGGWRREGMLRLSGSASRQNDARSSLKQGVVPDNLTAVDVGSMIKAFFREQFQGLIFPLSALVCQIEGRFKAKTLSEREYETTLCLALNLLPDQTVSCSCSFRDRSAWGTMCSTRHHDCQIVSC
jgi:hypothetical protein